MKEKARRRPRRLGLGALIARAVWLGAIAAGGWWTYHRYERGEWPWDLGARKLDGIALLARSSWGAAKGDGSTNRMSRPSRITIHHLGGKAVADLDRDAAGRAIKAIQADHMRRRGWNDIGYHYIVDRAGRTWEGRPITQTGAHAGSLEANQANVGVLLLGNFDVQSPTAPQLASSRRLVEALRRRFGIARGDVLSHNEVRCEGGLGFTSCPGKRLAAWVEAYRRGEAESAGLLVPASAREPSPNSRPASPPGAAGARLVKS